MHHYTIHKMPMKIELKNLNIVSHWNFPHNDCALCSHPLTLPQINDTQPSTPFIQSATNTQIALNACGHMFHKKCFDDAQLNSVTTCSTCNAPLKINNLLNTGSSLDQQNMVVKQKVKAKTQPKSQSQPLPRVGSFPRRMQPSYQVRPLPQVQPHPQVHPLPQRQPLP